MGRPPKKGLDYFPRDVNYYDDFKVIDLINEYGPAGQTIYDVILCMVYREGYFLEIALDKLAIMVTRIIGNKWAKKGFVLQVIHYCADIGLFDHNLLNQGVITSAGIQKRYAAVTVRNKVNKERFWLLEREDQAIFSTPSNHIKSSENRVSAAENQVDVANIPQRKENERKQKKSEREKNSRALYGRFKNVRLSDGEYQELEDLFCFPLALIDRLSVYKESTGREYKSDFATLLKWAEKDGDQKRMKPKPEEKQEIRREPMSDEMRKKMQNVFKGF